MGTYLQTIYQFKNVIVALIIRELKTRFGRYRLGYLWVFLEPFLHIAIFVGIRGILAGSLRGGVERFVYHIEYPLFLASGLLPFFLFRNTAIQLMNAISANRSLFFYKPVRPFDTFISRWFLEGIIFIIVWIVIFFLLDTFGFKFQLKNPLQLLLIYLLLYLFSLGVGITLAILVELYEELRQFIGILMLVLFFISCIFYSIILIPPKFRILLIWNPLVHFIELSRENFFFLYRVEICSWQYIIISTTISLFMGLSLYRLKIKKILSE